MEASQILPIVGGGVSLIVGIIYAVRKVLKSSCIRKADGTMALQISLSQTDADVVAEAIRNKIETRTPTVV